jgi:hypothetical protein
MVWTKIDGTFPLFSSMDIISYNMFFVNWLMASCSITECQTHHMSTCDFTPYNVEWRLVYRAEQFGAYRSGFISKLLSIEVDEAEQCVQSWLLSAFPLM